MTSTPERRIAIREYLSQARQTTIERLMYQYGVSRRTIIRDLDYIETELSVPLVRISGNGGGIRVIDGWTPDQRYLTPQEDDLLTRLLDGLQPEDRETMEGLLRSLRNPSTKPKK